jgi:hypothetical protein
MTRDELESVCWRHLTDARAVDAILAAADEYHDSAGRRAAIDAGLRTVHYQVPCIAAPHDGCQETTRACRRRCSRILTASASGILATTVARDVTCTRCHRSTVYLEALGRELAS